VIIVGVVCVFCLCLVGVFLCFFFEVWVYEQL